MSLTDFGKAIRKARIDLGETLSSMATTFNVSPAFLSAMETGRKNIPEEWVIKITSYFAERGLKIDKLGEYADLSNKTVSIAGQDPKKQMFIAGFARSNFDAETLARFVDLLNENNKKGNE